MYFMGYLPGPILLDSDEEPADGCSKVLCPARSTAAMDQVETQPFDLSTQVMFNALSELDKPVPSPAKRFADEKTKELGDFGSPSEVAPVSAEQETPSPRGIQPVEITPMKSFPTRDDQLGVKASNEAEKKDKKDEKNKAKAAGRGRGRGRGRGKKSLPTEAEPDAEEPDAEEGSELEIGEACEKPAGRVRGRPKAAEAAEGEPTKRGRGRGGGRGRGKKSHPEAEDGADAEPSKPKATDGGDAPSRKRAKKAESAVAAPATRVRGKRGLESDPNRKVVPKKSVQKNGAKDPAWPNTFARRYRPNSDNWTRKLREGCVLAFRSVLYLHIVPGQATTTQVGYSSNELPYPAFAGFLLLLQSSSLQARIKLQGSCGHCRTHLE